MAWEDGEVCAVFDLRCNMITVVVKKNQTRDNKQETKIHLRNSLVRHG